MKVQNIVRKAVALGSGAALVGTTLMGAFAYDLSTYPAKFIVDGKFDGKIVVGEKAATPDVIGAIDIAASLQGASVSKVAIPGAAGKVSFEGDSFEIATSSDALELREPIGDVAETITSDDLAGLKSGKLTTPEGSTNYQQYLRLQDGVALQDIAVNYVTNSGEDNEKMSDYMVVENVLDAPFIRWEVQFDEGFESELGPDAAAAVADTLEDFEDRTLNIMGTDYTIVSAEVENDGGMFEVQLMGGSVPDTLREGETKTYTINGVDYEVTLVFVSDPNSGGNPEVKFSVNGELTQALAEADTDVLSGGMQIGVRDILVNAREGVASFYLGAHKLVLTHPTSNGAYTGDVEINDDVTENDVVAVEGSVANGNYEITSIKYQIVMDSADGSGGVAYVPKGHGVRELMDEPELMISDALDIKYGGLTTQKTAAVVFDPNGDDEYTLTFTNIEGDEYKSVPFLSTDGVLRFGDQDDELVLVENTAGAGNIGVDDYFIVSSKLIAEADRSVTNVLRYDGYDGETRQIEFENLAGGSVSATLSTTGVGTFNVGGHTYDVEVNITGGTSNAASDSGDDDANIRVDLDGSGTITIGEVPIITSWGGLAFSFTNATNATGTLAVLGVPADAADLVDTIGTGQDFNDLLTSPVTVRFTGTVVERRFDTANGDETFLVTFTENAAADELDVDFVDASYDGPLFSNSNEWTKFEFGDSEDNSDIQTGMTDYGVLVRLDEPDDSSDPNTLTFNVPEEQVLAQVFVTMGDVSSTEGGAGVADKVNPIAVGLAVLDKDAPAVGSDNLIVVGGPCANTVAAELMGNPESCVEGFTEGKAMIKAFGTDKVSILVAGYSAQDTLGASRVLADYKAYSLKGEAVEVVVADLKNIKVNAME